MKDSQDISAQLIFYYIIDTNYDQKWLTGVRKSKIFLNKFKISDLKEGSKISHQRREKRNQVLKQGKLF